jgi:hypothetical protein
MRTFVAMCLGVLAVAAQAHANLIVNGSFETPLVPPGGTATFPGGSTAITGWTIVGVDSSLVHTNFTQSGITFQAQHGNQWLDAAGHTSNSMTSGVRQVVPTTPGGLYAISFYVGSARDNVFFNAATIDLQIDGGPRVPFHNPIAPNNMLHWQQFTVPFVATGSTTTITFYNGSAPNNFLSALDNVVMEGLVPEPSSLAVALIGAIGLWTCGRRAPLRSPSVVARRS